MEIATLNLDTYKVVKLLQEKGYTEAQAEGLISALQEITLTGVATKQDIADLKDDIVRIESRMMMFLLGHTVTIVGVMVAINTVF